MGELLGDAAPGTGEGRALDRIDIAMGEGEIGDLADEILEGVVARDEVGLRIDLDDGAGMATGGDADESLGGDAAGLFGGGGETFLAQPIDRALDIA